MAAALQNLLLAFWGLRLGIFLVRRELQPSYRAEQAAAQSGQREHVVPDEGCHLGQRIVPLRADVLAQLVCHGNARRGPASRVGSLVQWLGLTIMIGSLVLESLADRQKSAFKARNPNQFCDTGLYRWVRCPNYLGEILFWVGNWVAGIFFYTSPCAGLPA